MKRYLTMTADSRADGLSVEQVLRQAAGLSRRQISRAKFIPDGIMKNGMQCRVTERVVPGDCIQFCIEEVHDTSGHLESLEQQLHILYEDEDVLAVNKPQGMVTHPKGCHYADTLANQVVSYYRARREEHMVRPVGRLDRETSGIVVFAKNGIAAARLQEQREQGIFKKTYLAVVEGYLPVDGLEYQIDEPIKPNPENRLKMITAPDGKRAVTHYKILQSCQNRSLAEVWLETGRTHQIRVHMAALGHPLRGDLLYGTGKKDASGAQLHAWKVSFCQPVTGTEIHLEAPMPEEFLNMEPGDGA